MSKRLVTLCLALTLTLCAAAPAAASGLNTSEIISAAVSWVADIFIPDADEKGDVPSKECGPHGDPVERGG